MQLVLSTGLSVSGKSIALDALEDAGYYCVDNLPVRVVPELVGFLARGGPSRGALSIGVRSGQSLDAVPRHLGGLRRRGIDVTGLFRGSEDEPLIQRVAETR